MKRMFILAACLLLAACTTPPDTAVSTPTPTTGALAPVEPDAESSEPTVIPPTATPPPYTLPDDEPADAAGEAYPLVPAEPTLDPYAAPEEEADAEANGEESEAVDLLSNEADIKEVTIAATDDLPLMGTLFTPAGEAPFPGVILLHMVGSNRQVWTDNGFAQALTDSGYAVLAVDMRGHGDTGGERDWVQSVADMRSIHTYFVNRLEVDGEQTAVVGASIGSNMALVAGAEIPAIDTVVLLSPGLDYFGVTTEDRLTQYGERPLLIVASSEDSYSAESSQTLADSAFSGSQFELYEGAGHGTAMFGNEPELSELILNWLNDNIS